MENVIHVAGRRWFQRSAGNTYHSVTVEVDGESLGDSGKHYGYGESYEQTAVEMMQKAGFLYEYSGPLSLYCRDRGITLCSSVADVAREKDL